MKRLHGRVLVSTLILLVTAITPLMSQSTAATRTIVNAEGAPLVYLFVDRPVTPDRDAIIERLRAGAMNLREIAPRGLWRIPARAGTVVGYYGGGPSAVAYRIVVQALEAGSDPVSVGADAALDADRDLGTISPWDLPTPAEPVSLDGMNADWDDSRIVMRRTVMTVPRRIESIADGRLLTAAQSRLWETGGTSVRTIRSQVGREWVFLAVESSDAFLDGTGIHFRYFPRRDADSPAGAFVTMVSGESGPVVFRTESGRVSLVGQYVRRGRFLEMSISRQSLARITPDLFDRDISFDVATSRRDSTGGEQFALGTVYARDLFSR